MSFRCTYNDADHSYWFHDAGVKYRVPSVTQCLETLSKAAFASVNPIALELAAARGTAIHSAIHSWLENEQYPIEHGPQVEAFRQWASSVSFKPMYMERCVWSRRYGYAGRADLIGYVCGALSVVDIKTGVIPKHVGLQLAAYVQCINESVPKCQFAWINRYALLLGADGRSRMQSFDKQDLDFWTFAKHLRSTKELPQWKQQNHQLQPNSTSAQTHRSKSRKSSSSPTTSSSKRLDRQPKKSKAS